ncbi:alpha/beta hydrolase [Pedobacter sp. BAL39]|nr:alpha/beta hydrolase [Pedobacter sp. BAL39]
MVLLMVIMAGAGNMKAQEFVPLYPGTIPGAKTVPGNYRELTEEGTDGITRVSKVSQPGFYAFLPSKDKATGAAVIICPGGGYGILAISHEGYDVARQFNAIGVAAFVLKYRLPSDEIMTDKFFGPLADAQQAIYQLRKNASRWAVNPAKIGIMGFSAGGHLAATLTVHYEDVKIENQERLSLRPDFSILIYPVVSFGASAHTGSVANLIGKNGTAEQKDYFSCEKQVNAQTPPTFMVHANDDKVVPPDNSILFDQALVKAGVPAELHLYQKGGHGFGLHNKTTTDEWFGRLQHWMSASKIL